MEQKEFVDLLPRLLRHFRDDGGGMLDIMCAAIESDISSISKSELGALWHLRLAFTLALAVVASAWREEEDDDDDEEVEDHELLAECRRLLHITADAVLIETCDAIHTDDLYAHGVLMGHITELAQDEQAYMFAMLCGLSHEKNPLRSWFHGWPYADKYAAYGIGLHDALYVAVDLDTIREDQETARTTTKRYRNVNNTVSAGDDAFRTLETSRRVYVDELDIEVTWVWEPVPAFVAEMGIGDIVVMREFCGRYVHSVLLTYMAIRGPDLLHTAVLDFLSLNTPDL